AGVEPRELDSAREPAYERPDLEGKEKRASGPPQQVSNESRIRRDAAGDERHADRQRAAEAERGGVGEVFPDWRRKLEQLQKVKGQEPRKQKRSQSDPRLGEIRRRAQESRKHGRGGAR